MSLKKLNSEIIMNTKALKFWNANTFEFSTFQNLRKNFINKKTNKVGTDQSGKCIYTYNELGFRGDSPKKEGFKIMSVGCSNTEGLGLNDDETWSAQFCSLVKNSVNINLGVGGRSNDYIARAILTYYDVVSPDLILIQYTYPIRREFYTEKCGIEPFIPTHTWGFMRETDEGKMVHESLVKLQNDEEDFINWYKNHLLIKNFLENKKCNWIWNGKFSVSKDFKETNRFDGLKPFLDTAADGVHPGPITNKTYAYKLHKFIKENFPNYLPIDSYQKNTNLI